ncbi:MAG: MGMT family protein [Planctomycetaceae bacterium]
MSSPTIDLIYKTVRRVPKGRVATYGQIAALAGFPKHSRYVGYALRQLPTGSRVPWHRIVNARGEVSERGQQTDRDCKSEQTWRLLDEGVDVSQHGRISLAEYQYRPRK